MFCEFFIARHYLFSKKSHNAINIVSMISVVCVAVTTMALVCTLSVYNGFRGLVEGLFTEFDPDLKVTPARGYTMAQGDGRIARLRKCGDVAVLTPVMEGQALVVGDQVQKTVRIKGVADNFMEQSRLEDALYGEGNPVLHVEDVLEYGIPGIQLCSQLGLTTDFQNPLQVYAPKAGERINMANPTSSFNHGELQSSGLVFSVHQAKYDAEYIICSLGFAQRLFGQEGRISALEVKLAPGGSRKGVEDVLGPDFKVEDRYEQQEDVFRIMRVEKLISYAFLCFILLISCLNVIGAVSMLMIEKRADLQTLRSLGASEGQLRRVFWFVGELIILGGAAVGMVIGGVLCWCQQEFGIVRMGQSEGAFIIDAYPVTVNPLDILVIVVTVISVGSLSAWYAARR